VRRSVLAAILGLALADNPLEQDCGQQLYA
jgi:hypothetical protein